MLHSVSRPLSAPPRLASIPNGHRWASASRLSRSPAPPPSTGPASVELRRPRAPAGDLVCWLRLAPVALPCLRTASSADPAPRRRPHPSAPPQPRRAPLPTDCELRWPRAPTGDLVRWLRLAPAAFSCSRTASSAGPAPRRVPLLADLELHRTTYGDGHRSSLFPARRSRGGTAAAARGEVVARLLARAAGGRWVGEGPVVSGRTSGISGIPEPEPEIAGTRIVG